MDVLDLVAKITLDSSEYDKGLDSSKSKASTFGNALKSGIGTAAKIGATAIAAVGTAAVGASAAFVKGAGSLAEYGDNIDKMSQKMGISAQGYQEWEAVMQHSGTSMESLRAGMKTLANAVENGNDAFGRLGITQEQIASMDNEELFNATITALQNVDNETERTYLAGQLLGRGATELGALLNTSAEETQAMKDRVHELGGVMSDEAVKAAAHYQDTLQDMQTAFSGLQRGILSEFLPTITTVMEGLTALFSGDDSGLGKINSGITEFVNKMSDALPKVLDTGAQIVNSIVIAITENVPQLISAGASAVGTLASGLIDGIPVILESVNSLMSEALDVISNFDFAGAAGDIASKIGEMFGGDNVLSQIIAKGGEIISSLVSGIGQALPQLLPAAMDVISSLIKDLTQQIPQLISAAVDLIVGLAEGLTNPTSLSNMLDSALQLILSLVQGLIDNIPKITEAVPKIVENLTQTLVRFAPKLIVAAVEIMVQLVLGLIRNLPTLLKAVPEIIGALVAEFIGGLGDIFKVGEDIVNTLKDGIDTLNPREWAEDMMDSFVSGIKHAIGKVRDAVSNVADTVRSYLHFSEPDIGPLSDFHTYAPDMMKLFAKGMADNTDIVAKQMEKSFTLPDMSSDVSMTKGSTGMSSIGKVTINVYGAEGQSERKLAEEVADIILHNYNVKQSTWGVATT